MAKTTTDLKLTIKRYVDQLARELDLQEVFLVAPSYEGINDELSEVAFIVVSPTFEGMDYNDRLATLGGVGMSVSPVIAGRPFTPDEIARFRSGEAYDWYLAAFLEESREVYAKSSSELPRKAVGGNR